MGGQQAISVSRNEVIHKTTRRGIVHSLRTSDAVNPDRSMLAGALTWVALPRTYEENDLAFAYHGIEELPKIEGVRVRDRVISCPRMQSVWQHHFSFFCY